MPLQEELLSDGESWYKWYGEEFNTANFRLRATKGDWGFVNYNENDRQVEMYLSSMEGHTIAGEDFIQRPIIPGENHRCRSGGCSGHPGCDYSDGDTWRCV